MNEFLRKCGVRRLPSGAFRLSSVAFFAILLGVGLCFGFAGRYGAYDKGVEVGKKDELLRKVGSIDLSLFTIAHRLDEMGLKSDANAYRTSAKPFVRPVEETKAIELMPEVELPGEIQFVSAGENRFWLESEGEPVDADVETAPELISEAVMQSTIGSPLSLDELRHVENASIRIASESDSEPEAFLKAYFYGFGYGSARKFAAD